MKPLAASREDSFPASLLPFITVLLLSLLTTMPIGIPGYAAVTPLFTLMGVYHWTVYRPGLLPPLSLFAAGLFLDLLDGTPIGVSSLVFLLVRAALMGQRKFFVGRLFPFVWAGFALLAAGAAVVIWIIGSLLSEALLDVRLAALQWVLTVAGFPAASWVLGRLQRAVLSPVGAAP